MAVKNLYLIDTRVASGTNNHLLAQDGGVAPSDAAFSVATGWEANSKAAGQSALLASLAEVSRTAADWSATLQPSAAPSASRGDSWRAGPYNGIFANTAWTLSVVIRSITAAYAGRCRFRWRVWKSANADGSGATELTAAQVVSAATTAALVTTANHAPLTASWSPGSITLNNEYLFFQLGIEVTTAGTATTQDVNLRKHNSMAVTTPDFVANSSLALTGVASDESAGTLTPAPGAVTAALSGVATDETTGSLTASPGTATAALTGVATDEQAGSLTAVPINNPIPLSGVTTDEQTGSLTATPGAVTTSLAGVATDELAGTLAPTPGAVNASLTGVSTDESTGTLVATPGAVTAALAGLSSDETTGSVVGVPGTATVTLVGVGTDELVGTLSPSGVGRVTLPGVGSDELVGTLAAIPGTVAAALSGIGTDEVIGSLGASPGAVLLSLPSLSTDEVTGQLAAVAGDVTIVLSGVGSDELIGTLAGREAVIEIGETLARNVIRVQPREGNVHAAKEESVIRAHFANETVKAIRGVT